MRRSIILVKSDSSEVVVEDFLLNLCPTFSKYSHYNYIVLFSGSSENQEAKRHEPPTHCCHHLLLISLLFLEFDHPLVAIALMVSCLQHHIAKTIFHVLLLFFEEIIQHPDSA